jgi:YD repeat-containing protein
VKNNLLFLILFVGFSAHAEVNPLSGELTFDTVDLVTKEAMTPFKIQRQYSHKRKSYGIFGNNWCSQLEETVVRANAGLEIRKCGQTTASVFAKVPGGYANSAGTEIIQELPNGTGYLRVGSEYVFGYNEQGQLSLISRKNNPEKPFIHMYFNKYGMIDRVVHKGTDHYFFTFAKTEKVLEKITGPKKLQVTYSYDKNNNLLSVQNAWGKNLAYGYDPQGRINSFSLPNGEQHSVTYDPKLDAVSKLADTKNCGYEFSYLMDLNTAALKSTVKDVCGKSTQEFVSTSSPLFSKHRMDKDSLFRAPASINENLLKMTNGWQSITSKGVKWEYLEDTSGNVTQIKQTRLLNKRKKTLNTKYKNERLIELELVGSSKVFFRYKNGKLDKMEISEQGPRNKRYDAFDLFTEFLLAKNGVRNE